MAINAAISAYRLAYSDPAAEQAGTPFVSYDEIYRQRLAWYQDSIFDKSNPEWSQLLKNYNIYKKTRSLDNPVGNVCEFFAENVYPGGLSPDGKRLPDDIGTAMPFPDDTDEGLMAAIAQVWEWSNWDVGMYTHVLNAGIYGDNFIEVVDDTERGIVYFKEVYPGFVTDLTLDNRGNTKAYQLEYQATDPQTRKTYKYKKVVTRESFTEYRDNSVTAEWENFFGFVPARWFNFSGGNGVVHGPPAFKAFIALMELNGKLSQVSDHIGKKFLAPGLMTNVQDPKNVTKLFDSANQAAKAKAGNDYAPANPDSNGGDLLYLLTTPGDSQVRSLAGDLDISGSLDFIKMIAEKVDKRNPEINYWDRLREMSQLTGPAADRLSGDVKGKVRRAQSGFDKTNISLAQMAVAIAGYRAREGREGWRNRTKQQQKFIGFDLESYARGDLSFSFAPRPLIQPTALEKITEEKTFWEAVKTAKDTGIPLELILKDKGWSDDRIAEMKRVKLADQQGELDRIRQQQQLDTADDVPELPEGRQQ